MLSLTDAFEQVLLAALESFLTPPELFYVRCHYDIPKLDATAYRLEVRGAVKKPLSLSLDDLHRLKSVTVPATDPFAGTLNLTDRPSVSAGVPVRIRATL